MRTETRTYQVYPVVELTEQAQSNAHYKWLEDFDYSWSSDNRSTLEQFEELFSVNVRNWQYDSCSYNYTFLTSLSGDGKSSSDWPRKPNKIAPFCQNKVDPSNQNKNDPIEM